MPALRRRAPESESEVLHLRAEVARLSDQLARLAAEKVAIEAACHEDQVSGLLNRRGFLRELTRALSYARRYQTPAALLLIDLDRFKPINDQHGHEVGDLALRHVAAVLIENLRSSDTIGRIGGDEFAVLLWQVDETLARQKAGVLEAALDAGPFPVGNVRLGVSGSIGATQLRPDDDPASALARADRAMYARKAERRASADPLRR